MTPWRWQVIGGTDGEMLGLVLGATAREAMDAAHIKYPRHPFLTVAALGFRISLA